MASKLEIDSLTIRNSGNIFSSTVDGNVGDFTWDNSYLYLCVAENSWKRVALSDFGDTENQTIFEYFYYITDLMYIPSIQNNIYNLHYDLL